MKLKIKKSGVKLSFSKKDVTRKNAVGFGESYNVGKNLTKRKICKNIEKLFNACDGLPNDTIKNFSLKNAELNDEFNFNLNNLNFGQYLKITTKNKLNNSIIENDFLVVFDFQTNVPSQIRNNSNFYFGVSSSTLQSVVVNNFKINNMEFYALQKNGNGRNWYYASLDMGVLNNYSTFKKTIIDLIDSIRTTYSLF